MSQRRPRKAAPIFSCLGVTGPSQHNTSDTENAEHEVNNPSPEHILDAIFVSDWTEEVLLTENGDEKHTDRMMMLSKSAQKTNERSVM